MALVYFDTSALVKLLVLETGSPLAVALWERADAVVTSRIADVEVKSVLAAAERIGRIDAAPAAAARDRWTELWPGLHKVEVTAALADHAADLADRRPLARWRRPSLGVGPVVARCQPRCCRMGQAALERRSRRRADRIAARAGLTSG